MAAVFEFGTTLPLLADVLATAVLFEAALFWLMPGVAWILFVEVRIITGGLLGATEVVVFSMIGLDMGLIVATNCVFGTDLFCRISCSRGLVGGEIALAIGDTGTATLGVAFGVDEASAGDNDVDDVEEGLDVGVVTVFSIAGWG